MKLHVSISEINYGLGMVTRAIAVRPVKQPAVLSHAEGSGHKGQIDQENQTDNLCSQNQDGVHMGQVPLSAGSVVTHPLLP